MLAAIVVTAGLCLGHAGFWRSVARSENLRIDEEIDTVIIGDSHTQTGIDEKWLGHAVNISSNSMHYLFAYAVLRRLLEANPQIKTVLLGYSYHNPNAYYDQYLWERNQTKALLDDYYFLLDNQERRTVRNNNWSFWGTHAKYVWGLPVQLDLGFYAKAIHGGLKADDFPFWGKPYKSVHSNLSKSFLRKTILAHFYQQDEVSYQGISSLQIQYLQAIVELCRAKSVKLVLLTMPLHPSYRAHIPDAVVVGFENFTRDLQNRYPEISHWDFSNDPFADFMFGDHDHLNVYGSKVFSHKLKLRLEVMGKE